MLCSQARSAGATLLRSCAQPTTFASTAAPMQQEAAAVHTAPWEPEQAAADLLLPEPQKRQGVPVYVMLPLDTVNSQGHFQYASTSWFARALGLLHASGVEGVAVDVWWGAVERQPGSYDWSGYQQLFSMVKAKGLRIQAVMSFHACGGNVGDYAQVPLPDWVFKCGEEDPSLFCTDRPRDGLPGTSNNEYISLFADQASVLHGRTALECYADFMHAFREAFIDDIGAAIHEIAVGGGPCGELRYPSYVETQGWRFPGAGEFQCYDRRALTSLAEAAAAVEQPEWGKEGPHDAGEYNSWPEDTGFFRGWGGAWDSPYGHFFMKWYSDNLLLHGERLCKIASSIFNTSRPKRCTSKYRSCHCSSPLNPMSAASHLASVLRPPLDPNPPPQKSPQAESQQLPFDQPPASLTNADALLGRHEPTRAGPSEPMTPTLGGPTGAAPLPTSWPTAQNPQAQHDSQPDVDATKQQGQQQQLTGSLAQEPSSGETAVLPAIVQSDDMTMEQSEVSCSSRDDAGDVVSGTQHTSQHDTEPPLASTRQQRPMSGHASGHPDSMHFRPPDKQDFSAAQSAAALEVSAATQAQGRSQWQPAGRPVEVSLKIAGVHWWYNSRSHAAEMTAGYYNTEVHDGYAGMLEMCAQHGMVVTLTCVEMCDAQHPPEALCGPEGLLRQVREGAAAAGVLLGGENALPCFVPGGVDQYALDRIVYNTKPWSPPLQMDTMANQQMQSQEGHSEGCVTEDPGLSAAFWQERYGDSAVGPVRTLPVMRSFTFLRLIPDMMSPEYQSIWFRFMQQMQQTSLSE
ncbi:hypothetical protein WJX77_011689 [Trebouxia sp. C0004]